MWFTTIKRYYDMKYPAYTNENMKAFVRASMITPAEYEQITGMPYVA